MRYGLLCRKVKRLGGAAQVEPVEWGDKRLRRVLNTAVASVVTGDMIRAADFAVSTGYCGSLTRRTSSRLGARPLPPFLANPVLTSAGLEFVHRRQPPIKCMRMDVPAISHHWPGGAGVLIWVALVH